MLCSISECMYSERILSISRAGQELLRFFKQKFIDFCTPFKDVGFLVWAVFCCRDPTQLIHESAISRNVHCVLSTFTCTCTYNPWCYWFVCYGAVGVNRIGISKTWGCCSLHINCGYRTRMYHRPESTLASVPCLTTKRRMVDTMRAIMQPVQPLCVSRVRIHFVSLFSCHCCMWTQLTLKIFYKPIKTQDNALLGTIHNLYCEIIHRLGIITFLWLGLD